MVADSDDEEAWYAIERARGEFRRIGNDSEGRFVYIIVDEI